MTGVTLCMRVGQLVIMTLVQDLCERHQFM
jgi:hypothetical protein